MRMRIPHTTAPKTRATLAALVLAAPLLSACGFNNSTDRPYTQGEGTNNISGVVNVLNAVIVSAEDGKGVLVASLGNGSLTEAASLDDVSSDDPALLTAEKVTPIEIAPGGFVNLATAETPVAVSGSFVAGDFVPVSLGFSNGERVALDVPVIVNCGPFAEVTGVTPGPDVCLPSDEGANN